MEGAIKHMPEDWDERATHAGACFLQSSEWGSLQRSMGKETKTLDAGELRGLILKNPLPFGFSYYYVPRGPFGDVKDSQRLRAFAAALRRTADPKTLFLRIEPFVEDSRTERGSLREAGFAAAPFVQPKETILLDLSKTEDELLKAMEHNTRYAIRAAERRGVLIRKVSDPAERKKKFNDFWELFSVTNDRHSLKAFPRDYYERVATLDGGCSSTLFFAEFEGRPIATAIIVRFGTIATYLYAASKSGFGRYNAPSFLLWEAMRAAKADGCDTFDLWGISGTKKKWAGVTSFKKGFGGNETAYVGTWDLPFHKILYRAYMLLGKIKH